MGNACFGGHSNPTEGSQPKNSSTGTLTTITTSNDNSSSKTTTSTESSNLVSPALLSVMLPPKQSGSKSLHCFTYNDLKNATRNFRRENFLGEGGFGAVYKGWIDEQGYTPTKSRTGMVIAVKKLHPDSMQGHKEWLTEVQFLGELHHSNLVRLVGFCAEDDYRLLAYEYMSRGSLESHLFRRGTSISWAIRMQVALGAAKGLAFLHDQKVIFRDFKTSNILLDSECNAKLSDFGLAKEGPSGDNTHVSTGVKGTYGYAAPEYVATGHLSCKSDIFSFGVVLLELLTGRRTIDKNLPFAEQNLVDWAKPYLNDKKKIYRFIDPRLGGKYSSKGAQKIVAMASRCLQMDAKARPEMVEIVEMLESLVSSKETTKDA